MQRRIFLASAAAAAATPLIGSCAAKREAETAPQDLLDFGSRFELGDGAGAGQTVTLEPRRGPAIDLRSGALAVADPWFPEALPQEAAIRLPAGQQQSLISTISLLRAGKPVTLACAAAIGALGRVASWRPLVRTGEHPWLDSDSALGAFFDIADGPALRPAFEDSRHMFGVYRRLLKEQVGTMDVAGRPAAVVFLCPDGSATYPVHAGFDALGRAVAVLVDLKILNPRRPWNSLSAAHKVGSR